MNRVLFSLLLALPALSMASPAPLRVGVIAPLSGSAAAYGSAVRNGITLFLEEHPDHKVQYLFEDDQFLAQKTVVAFHKLTGSDHVDILLSTASTQSAAIAPLVEQRGIPLIGWVSDARVSKGRRFVIRSWMSGFAEGAAAAEAARKAHFARSGVVISSGDYGSSVRDGFVTTLPKNQLLLQEEFLSTERDFRALASRIKERNLDSLYVCVDAGPLALFARQLHQLQVRPQIIGCESLYNAGELKAAQGALDGAWFITAGMKEDFHRRYIRRFNADDAISGAAIHYDIASLLEHFAVSGRASSELIPFLFGLGDREGAIGRYKVVREDGDQYFHIGLVVMEVKGEGFLLKERLNQE